MNLELSKLSTEQLVTIAIQRRKAANDAEALLKEVTELLVRRAPGQYAGANEGEMVTVVGPTEGRPGRVTYELEEEQEERARELAGDQFGLLFDRKVVFAPATGFEHLAPKLLTPAAAKKIVKLCEKIGKPVSGRSGYVLYK